MARVQIDLRIQVIDLRIRPLAGTTYFHIRAAAHQAQSTSKMIKRRDLPQLPTIRLNGSI